MPTKGLLTKIKTYLVGESKAKHITHTTTTPTDTTEDTAIQPESYRHFRRDEVVRRCIITNAAFSTFAAGFDTEIEPVDDSLPEETRLSLKKKYAYVKAYVDQVNRQVNLDNALFIAQVKRSIYGKTGFELVLDKKKNVSWLLSLQSTKLKPELNSDWELTSFEYDGKPQKYGKEEILYFINNQYENDYEGLSDVEPIYYVCQARRNLIKTDFPKITKRMWAPYTILKADTTGMTDSEETAFLDALTEDAQAGASMATNKAIESTVVSMNIDMAGLITLMEKLEETQIRAFGTPRFLLNKPNENRATAYTEYEAYIAGPISSIQRYFKRELEAQWYPNLVKKALSLNGVLGEVEVKVSHNWRTIRATDIYQMATAAAALYNNGLGLLGDFPELAFDLVGLDKTPLDKLKEEQLKQQKQTPGKEAPKTEDQKTDETVMLEDATA